MSAHVPNPGMAQRHPLTSTLDLQQPATYFCAFAQLCHNTQGPTMLPWDPAPDVSALWQVSGVPQDHLPAGRAAQAHDRRPQRSAAPSAGVHGPPGKGLHPRPAGTARTPGACGSVTAAVVGHVDAAGLHAGGSWRSHAVVVIFRWQRWPECVACSPVGAGKHEGCLATRRPLIDDLRYKALYRHKRPCLQAHEQCRQPGKENVLTAGMPTSST